MDTYSPRDGDVLVSASTATAENEICIIPHPPHITCANHGRPVAEARELAEQLEVDAWVTEDNLRV